MSGKRYPGTLYVYREEAGSGEEWLRAEEQPHDLADPKEPQKLVGIYKFVSWGRLITEVALKPVGDPALEGAGEGE